MYCGSSPEYIKSYSLASLKEAGICSVFDGDDADGSIGNIRVVLLEPLDNATDASAMVFPDCVGHALIFGHENG